MAIGETRSWHVAQGVSAFLFGTHFLAAFVRSKRTWKEVSMAGFLKAARDSYRAGTISREVLAEQLNESQNKLGDARLLARS